MILRKKQGLGLAPIPTCLSSTEESRVVVSDISQTHEDKCHALSLEERAE